MLVLFLLLSALRVVRSLEVCELGIEACFAPYSLENKCTRPRFRRVCAVTCQCRQLHTDETTQRKFAYCFQPKPDGSCVDWNVNCGETGRFPLDTPAPINAKPTTKPPVSTPSITPSVVVKPEPSMTQQNDKKDDQKGPPEEQRNADQNAAGNGTTSESWFWPVIIVCIFVCVVLLIVLIYCCICKRRGDEDDDVVSTWEKSIYTQQNPRSRAASMTSTVAAMYPQTIIEEHSLTPHKNIANLQETNDDEEEYDIDYLLTGKHSFIDVEGNSPRAPSARSLSTTNSYYQPTAYRDSYASSVSSSSRFSYSSNLSNGTNFSRFSGSSRASNQSNLSKAALQARYSVTSSGKKSETF